MTSRLTFVTVVFEAETPLLELQARSMAMYLDPAEIDQILILDNCVRGMSAPVRRRIAHEYGPLGDKLRIVRTTQLIDPGATGGWRSQQAAKLAIAARVRTPHYVVLDAKNHFTRATSAAEFVDGAGLACGRPHPYGTHPLRASLVSTLQYLGAGDDRIDDALRSFPPTATPFVFDTAVVRALIEDIELRSGLPFGDEFERHNLLEFFLYAGWVETRGPGLAALRNDIAIPSPTVWPKAASEEGVREAVAEHDLADAAVFAVHRQVIAKADQAVLEHIAAQWTAFRLFPDSASARAFIRRFRRRYLPALVWTRGMELVRRVLRRRAGVRGGTGRAPGARHGKRAPRVTSPADRSETPAM